MITISIPTHNRPKLLKKAIASILNQTYKDFKLVILDNASSPSTLNVVNDFDDIRISYFRSEINSIKFINEGFKQNKRKYLMIMHDDDTLSKFFLQNQISILEKNNKISAIGSSVNLIDEKDKKLNKIRPFLFKDKVFSKYKFINEYLIHGDIIPCPTVIYRSSFVRKYNIELPQDVGPARDLYLFFKINLLDSIIYLSKSALYNYRVHNKQDSEINRVNLELEIRPHIFKLLKKNNLKSLSEKYKKASAAFIFHLIVFRFITKQLDYVNFKKTYHLIRNDGFSINFYSVYWSLFMILRVIKLKLRIKI